MNCQHSANRTREYRINQTEHNIDFVDAATAVYIITSKLAATPHTHTHTNPKNIVPAYMDFYAALVCSDLWRVLRRVHCLCSRAARSLARSLGVCICGDFRFSACVCVRRALLLWSRQQMRGGLATETTIRSSVLVRLRKWKPMNLKHGCDCGWTFRLCSIDTGHKLFWCWWPKCKANKRDPPHNWKLLHCRTRERATHTHTQKTIALSLRCLGDSAASLPTLATIETN